MRRTLYAKRENTRYVVDVQYCICVGLSRATNRLQNSVFCFFFETIFVHSSNILYLMVEPNMKRITQQKRTRQGEWTRFLVVTSSGVFCFFSGAEWLVHVCWWSVVCACCSFEFQGKPIRQRFYICASLRYRLPEFTDFNIMHPLLFGSFWDNSNSSFKKKWLAGATSKVHQHFQVSGCYASTPLFGPMYSI